MECGRPQPEEIAWAREVASPGEHLLALTVQLKAFGRLGYFPALDEEPADLINIALERLVEGSVVPGRADDQAFKIKYARPTRLL